MSAWEKGLKHRLQLIVGDADAGISDSEQKLSLAARGLRDSDAELDLALRSELDCVSQQIGDYLAHSQASPSNTSGTA
jgi:hypothetical protein